VEGQKNVNRLLATVHWNEKAREAVAGPSDFAHSHLELSVERTSVFTFDEAGYFYNPDTGVVVSIIGYIANIYHVRDGYKIQATNDVEILERIYYTTISNDQLSFLDELDGVYFVLVYDEKREKIYLTQSEFGCPLPVYYTSTAEKFVVSTSMKLLLQEAGIGREFYIPSVLDFMSYTEIIPNEHTLVKGVEKLVTQRNMAINIRSRKRDFFSFSPQVRALMPQEAEGRLLDSIGNQIKLIARHLRKPACTLTLTGGWDSNLMLSFLEEGNAERINAVTINGGGPTNEIPAVEHVLKFYSRDRVQHFTHTMQKSVFAMLPDIVWILEGYMFQSGMFLRYALSKLIRGIGSSSVFLGSGADPILNSEMGPGGNLVYDPYPAGSVVATMSELKKTLRNFCIGSVIGDVYFGVKGEAAENWIRRKCLRPGFRQRYNIQIEYNMKMHELMLNSFGVQGLYPFINKDTVSCAQALRPWNNGKSLYKQKVKERLGPDISSILRKSHAVVDTDKLFEANNHWLQKILHSGFINEVLPARQVDNIKGAPGQHCYTLLKVLYLYLFERLFLSGQYDEKFGSTQIDNTLEQVFT
jgi:asparagine synthetase B (glutamine-hydrolysing)